MSGANIFDTHHHVKRLMEAGFTEKQAETLVYEHIAMVKSFRAASPPADSKGPATPPVPQRD